MLSYGKAGSSLDRTPRVTMATTLTPQPPPLPSPLICSPSSGPESLGEGCVQPAFHRRGVGGGVCERHPVRVSLNTGQWRGAAQGALRVGPDPQHCGQHGGLCTQAAALEDHQEAR